MVKYSSSLKAKIVGEYLQGNISAKGIAEKYYLPRRQVAHWIQRYRLSGVDSLKRRNVKREFSAELQLRQLVNKSEVERLREELAEKNKELYDTKLERDILKKSVTLFGPSKGNEKHK